MAEFDKTEFLRAIDADGCAVVADALPEQYVRDAKAALAVAIEAEVRYHGGTEYADYGMVLLCSLYGKVFCDLFDFPLITGPINAALGEGSIVYAYTSSSMPPGGGNYSQRIHVDSPRLIEGYVTNLGATILLDDFTSENGATRYLPGSHRRLEQPSDEEFSRDARTLIARAGSVWFFNARVWHAGGRNRTAQWRHALTVNMVRPWMKQRIDIPRAMAHIDVEPISEIARQKLGFYAQVPANYDEYYVEPSRRKFRQKVE